MATLSDLANTIKGLHVHSVENVFPDTQGNVDIEIHKHNVGEEWHSYLGIVPVGGLPYLGQLAPRETYSALWNWVQSQDGLLLTEEEWQAKAAVQGGNCAYYSSGTDGTNFRLPAIFGYIKGIRTNETAGSYIAEGLPNITGCAPLNTWFESENNFNYAGSALYRDNVNHGMRENASGTAGDYTFFDASLSNPIYGASNHVTPETSLVMFGVWAFGEVTNIGQVEMSDVVTDFEKLRTDLNANKIDKTTPHITETWVDGTSWYRVWSDGYIEQGGNDIGSSFPTKRTIVFPKPFSSIPSIAVGQMGESTTSSYVSGLDTVTTTNFSYSGLHTNSDKGNSCSWIAVGY